MTSTFSIEQFRCIGYPVEKRESTAIIFLYIRYCKTEQFVAIFLHFVPHPRMNVVDLFSREGKVPEYSIGKDRYDLGTYSGRLMHFVVCKILH